MKNTQFNLKDKVAVVTGAGGLIGKNLCIALSNAGASVVACDINIGKIADLKDYLSHDSILTVVDVSQKESIEKLKEHILFIYDQIDVIVNSAAINDVYSSDESLIEQTKFENYSLEMWEKSFKVNVTGTFLVCQILGTELAKRKSGSIINISSSYGIVAPDQSIYQDEEGNQKFYKSPSYPAGKGAVIMLTKFLASYWGEKNIRVNCISPGGVEDSQDANFIKNYKSKTQLKKMAKPDDFNGAVVFLASEASSYMTGTNLIVDGGWTAW